MVLSCPPPQILRRHLAWIDRPSAGSLLGGVGAFPPPTPQPANKVAESANRSANKPGLAGVFAKAAAAGGTSGGGGGGAGERQHAVGKVGTRALSPEIAAEISSENL